MYRNNSLKNIIIKNSNNSKSGTNMIVWIVIYLVVAFLISYITVMTFKYLTTDCIDKKSWFQYVFRFCFQEVCDTPNMETVTHVNFNSSLPKNFQLPKSDEPKINNPPKDSVEIKNYTNTILSTGPGSNPSFEYNTIEQKEKPQVFHIGNQDYSYNQAKCKCASYNAKLATYSQLVDAYNNGAEWCSYGWSEGQNAYYPTQKCNWLKKNEAERKACGKPGINGGFFGDPNLKFGANCYGKKPKGKVLKLEEKECDYCNVQPNYSANHIMETDQILPFNEKTWSA